MITKIRVKVFIASQDASGREEIALALENLDKPLAIEWDFKIVDITIWEHQVEAFHTVIGKWGRVDYVFANAGVGERVWLPTITPADGEFSKPDLSVYHPACPYLDSTNSPKALDVNLTGTMYTIALAIQQFRRQNENDFGFKGKRKFHIIALFQAKFDMISVHNS
jgi:NAD(P)-dependent dehydrogenase (short-subunit alcohol dehydrogenase family)